MTVYGYARVSVREPEDKNLDLQVERLVRAGCSMGNIRAEEASGAKDDRGGLLELLGLVVEGDTLVVTHIDRLSRGLTYGLQVIEGLHHAGVEFRSLSDDFDTATATGKLQLAMVLAFSEWWRNSIREPERSAAGVHLGGAVEGSEPAGTGQAPGGQPLDHPAGGQVGVGWQTRPEVDQAEAVITWHGDLIRSYAVQAASEKVTRLANETITMLREKREKVVKEDGSIGRRWSRRTVA